MVLELNEKNLKIPENGAIRAVEAVLSTKQQRAVNVSFQSILAHRLSVVSHTCCLHYKHGSLLRKVFPNFYVTWKDRLLSMITG